MPETKKPKAYARMSEELAELIEWFEGDQVDLDKAIEKYQAAAKLIKQMEEYLSAAENKIKKISLEL